MIAILQKFRQVAEAREVDTTNDKGYAGYKGTEYRYGKFTFMAITRFFKWGEPQAEYRFVHGSSMVTRQVFMERLKSVHKEEFENTM